ncbi:formyltransferase family protein [uncultured Litoreibacter sp.]|uniref:formyltransferase family protein n=1 Tax=uncultured Litoreibacter sp. TaxID=1392394 RepID=UPI002627FB73|nr:formyltransferase family protein [uncultured Litoreibacter sp.]
MHKRILCISTAREALSSVLDAWGDCIYLDDDPSIDEIDRAVDDFRPDLVVVFGCRFAIPQRILSKTEFFNVHLALLPRCRGPVPHIWSLIEGGQDGVTLHKMNAEIDEGPIVAQRVVSIQHSSHTLNSAFELLLSNAMTLLATNMNQLKSGKYLLRDQIGKASQHTLKQQSTIQQYVEDNLDLPLVKFVPELRRRVDKF